MIQDCVDLSRRIAEAFEGLTVCVLPFETAAPSAQAEELGRGIGSEVRAGLSRLPGLRLIRASGEKAPAKLCSDSGRTWPPSAPIRRAMVNSSRSLPPRAVLGEKLQQATERARLQIEQRQPGEKS